MNSISSLKARKHFPVMLDQVLRICNPKNGGLFLDCTFGTGGYSNAILSFPKTKVIALDRDENTFEFSNTLKKNYKTRFSFHNLKFSELNKVINKNSKPDFIIFDLGLSSLQISDLKRGFSFNSRSTPDMRMGLNNLTAANILNNFDLQTLSDIFKVFGEEKEGYKIAKNIIEFRKKSPIQTIPDLLNIIKRSNKRDLSKKINISTKTFQAIRIFINNEVSELIEGLIKASQYLKKGGKIIVISFHSIEDKIVKFFFTNYAKNKSRSSRYYPDFAQDKILFENYKNKVLRANKEELLINNPSRSAKLRYTTRSKDDFVYPIELKKKFANYLELESRNV